MLKAVSEAFRGILAKVASRNHRRVLQTKRSLYNTITKPKMQTFCVNYYYPPGTQEIYNSFSSRNLIMENGKKLEFPEGREGVRGLESAKRILMTGGSLYDNLQFL
jgi:hypothetical protein